MNMNRRSQEEQLLHCRSSLYQSLADVRVKTASAASHDYPPMTVIKNTWLACFSIVCCSCRAAAFDTDLPALTAGLVAQDMVHVMKADWPVALTHIWVEPASSLALDGALRHAGYAIEPESGAHAIPALLTFWRLDDLNWHRATLAVNKSWVLTRFYRHHNGKLTPVSGFTLGGGRGTKGPIAGQSYRINDESILATSATQEYWYIEVLRTTQANLLQQAQDKMLEYGYSTGMTPALDDEQTILRVGPFVRSNAARASLGHIRSVGFDMAVLIAASEMQITPPRQASLKRVPVKAPPCTHLSIRQGSLRASIETLLTECGYSMGHWGLGAGADTHDWIIKNPYIITTDTGIWGLLDLLTHTYGIQGSIRQVSTTVDFQEAQ